MIMDIDLTVNYDNLNFYDLQEGINGKYKNNVKLVEQIIYKYKGNDEMKEESIEHIYNIAYKLYNENGENENIILLLSKINKKLNICYNYEKGNYRIMKLLFDNGYYVYDSIDEPTDIFNIPNNNKYLSGSETIKFKNEALLKYNIYRYNEILAFPYDIFINNYEMIKDKLLFIDVWVYGINTDKTLSKYKMKLLDKVCQDNLSNIALKILKDEENYIDVDKMQYRSDYAFKKALENEMKEVVFKMVEMRNKYKINNN